MEPNKTRKRKRVAQYATTCSSTTTTAPHTHNKTFHSALINQNKVILYKEIANAPKNPFEAAKKAYLKTKHANELLALVKETDESAATREESVKSRTVAEGTLS